MAHPCSGRSFDLMFDFYAGDHTPLFPKLSKEKFTFRVSDQIPLWSQVYTDNEMHQLDQIIQGG